MLENNEYLKAKNGVTRLVDLTKNIVSVLESVLVTSEPLHRDRLSIFSLNETLERAIFAVKQIFYLKSSEISQDLSSGLYVCGVEENFVQIFTNIIRNALEASEEFLKNQNKNRNSEIIKSPIKLRIETKKKILKDRSYALVKIMDFGPGIPKATIQNIFDAYFSSKRGINRGLGLWVVREFVEMFGGFIEVDSPIKDLQIGTSFTIYFPLVENLKTEPQIFWSKKIKQQWEEI